MSLASRKMPSQNVPLNIADIHEMDIVLDFLLAPEQPPKTSLSTSQQAIYASLQP